MVRSSILPRGGANPGTVGCEIKTFELPLTVFPQMLLAEFSVQNYVAALWPNN